MISMDVSLESLLRTMIENGASDLHLAVGSPPAMRIDGLLRPMPETAPLDMAAMEAILYPVMDADQRDRLVKTRELDFSYSIPGLSRFRGNVLWQRGTLGAVFRAIPARPITLEELGLPPVITELACRPRGLVLVTGPTGSGKSTTLAAMIDYINTHFDHHIVTIEDPIEFMHRNKRCIVRQRELGADTLSFAAALKHVLRQDPDVILVGEMRDLETISLAVTAAETGHLVFGTLHTTSAASTVDRVIDVFPSGQQAQIRMQLAGTLEGVISQTLLPRAEGRGRVCAMEIMIGTSAIRNMIREGKTHQIVNMLQSGGAVGMQTLNSALKLLIQTGVVTLEEALAKSSYPDELRQILAKG
jgi:twitching motility protein PilT